MSAGWSARLQRVLVLGVAASMLSVGSGFAQQQPGGTPPPGGAEPGVPPGTQQENPPDTRPGPPFELEAGYALTNVARNIQGIVVGVAADPSGNVYYVTTRDNAQRLIREGSVKPVSGAKPVAPATPAGK